MHQVALEPAPPALKIDDFEDGDDVPISSRFGAWHCETSPGPPRASCGPVGTGSASGLAEVVRFELLDPPNGVFDYASVVLETSARLGTLDLGDYESLAFSAKFELSPGVGNGDDPENDRRETVDLFVQLLCDGAGESGSLPYGAWLEYLTPIGPEWSSLRVELAQLIRPNHVLNLDRLDCMANVEALLFGLGPELADGEALAGTFTIDDVSLQ